MTDERMRQLRALVEAATPGPWRWDDADDSLGAFHDEGTHYVSVAFGEPTAEGNHRICIDDRDAAYIAAASPDVVLALIRVARTARDHLRGDDAYGLADALAALGDER